MENTELSDEIKKIRERTFNPEFKELIAKVINKPQDAITIDNPNSLLFFLHELYYTVLSKSFNDSIAFINPEIPHENRLQLVGEELLKKLNAVGFVEALIFQYDFKQSYFGVLNNSFKEEFFKDFYITLSDDIYQKIINEPYGIIINYSSIRDNENYNKRLKVFGEGNFLIWAFSSYYFVKNILTFLHLPFSSAIEIFCPIIFVRVHEQFKIHQNIINEFYFNCIATIFSMIELCLSINKGLLFLNANYFHEIFKVFENYYYISRSNEYAKYVIIKSKYEDQSIYCLFRYLLCKINKFKTFSCINYRPMIGLIVLFLYEENKFIINEIERLSSFFNEYIKIGVVDKSKIKNAVNLYKYIIDL